MFKLLKIKSLKKAGIVAVMAFLWMGVEHHVRAGSISKGFEALSVYDYFKAREIFEKKMNRWPVAAGCGLSYIFSANTNPFYNLDSARKYILIAEQAFPATSAKRREKLGEFQIDSVRIQVQKSKVARLAFEEVSKQGKLEDLESYITIYPFSNQLNEAIETRNELAFEKAREENTSAAYMEFITKYPQARQIREAKRRYDKILYLEETAPGDVETYESFIRYHPDSPYILEAMDRVYEKSIRANTVKEYARFIREYPHNKNVDKAWRVLYALYMQDYSPERMAEFRLDYPDYPFRNELMKDFSLSFKAFYPIRENGLWGFMDEQGEEMVDIKYEWVGTFNEGLAVVQKGSLYGYIDKMGNIRIPIAYQEAESFRDGYAIVMKEGKYGVINKANLVQVPFRYDELGEFNNGLAYVGIDGKYGYIDIDNKVMIDLVYDGCGDFDGGYAYVKKGEKYGIIDRLGDVVVPIDFDWLENFREGMARVRQEDLFGLYNVYGEQVVPPAYDHMGIFSEGRCLAAQGDKFGYLDEKGKEVIPLQFEFELAALNWGQFRNSHAKIKIKGKYGLIDTTGKRSIPAIFEDIGEYSDLLIPVKKRDLWGFCDREARLKIPYRYEYAWGFGADSLSKVRKDGKTGYIDLQGNEVIYVVYEEIADLREGRAIALKEGKYGLVSLENTEIVPFEYDEMEYINNLLLGKKENKMIYLSPTDGTVVWREPDREN